MFAFLLSLLLVFPQPFADSRAGDATAAANYEKALSDILAQAVTDAGTVRYDLLRGDLNGSFRSVLKAVEEFDLGTLDSYEERLAFWMNAYNVQMLQNIIETPGVANIINDGMADRYFKTPYRTAQRDLSLDQIENVILRRGDGPTPAKALQVIRLDPRIHVGLNCAAVSCPRLRQRAFTAENVDAELDAAMRDFVNSPQHFRVEADQFVLSSLLDWFGPDFDAALPAGDFLLKYMSPERPNYLALRDFLQGKTSAQIRQHGSETKAGQKGLTYEYNWPVNAAS